MAPRKSTGHTSDNDDADNETELDYEPDQEDDEAEYRIQNALKVPRATTYTAQALYDQICDGYIELDPDYQRDVVWNQDKQTRLIDSVLRNFYIPPIIFAVTQQADGSERKICIDGKQRLTSIVRFMNGLIPHKDPFTSKKYFYKHDSSGKGRKILPEQYRRLFVNKQVVCVEYTDLNPADERDIFQRVQLGVALTPSEKLAAIDTPRCRWLRELTNMTVVKNLPFQQTRAADFRVLGGYAASVMFWPTVKDIAISPSKWVGVKDAVSDGYKDDVLETLEIVSRVNFRLGGDKNGKKRLRVPPVEMIAIMCMVHQRKRLRSEKKMQEEIDTMSKSFSNQFSDLRMNHTCGVWVTAWIKNLESIPEWKTESSPQNSLKRPRDDDDDDDENPQRLPSPRD